MKKILITFFILLITLFGYGQTKLGIQTQGSTTSAVRQLSLYDMVGGLQLPTRNTVPTWQKTLAGDSILQSFYIDSISKSIMVIQPSGNYTVISTSLTGTYQGTLSNARLNADGFSTVVTTDFGGGTWYYDASDNTSADNTGTCFITQKGARYKRIWNGYVNIQWWGSKGDGDTSRDDAANLISALTVARNVYMPRGSYILKQMVTLVSDANVFGDGYNYGGTTVRNLHGGTTFKGSGSTHTRITIRDMKILSQYQSTKSTSYHIDLSGGFMDNIQNVSIGDVSGIGWQQNGVKISGTDNYFANIRILSVVEDPLNADSTGIAFFNLGTSNKFQNIQCETDSKIYFKDGAANSVYNLHCERSNFKFINSTNNLVSGAYFIDGLVSLDERSAKNTFENCSAINIKATDAGLFNRYINSNFGNATHGCTNYGLDEKSSYIEPTIIATAWNSVQHKIYKIPVSGDYLIAVQVANRTGANPDNGAVRMIRNFTDTLKTLTFSLASRGTVTAQGVNVGESISKHFVVSLNAGDSVIFSVNGNAGGITANISPIQNINPQMVNGAGWGANVFPVGTSGFFASVGCTQLYDSVYKVAVTNNTAFSISQFFTPKNYSDQYLIGIEGDWSANISPSIMASTNAHDGSRTNSVRFTNPVTIGGHKFIYGYVDANTLMYGNRSYISFGAFSNGVKATDTIKVYNFFIAPVGKGTAIAGGSSTPTLEQVTAQGKTTTSGIVLSNSPLTRTYTYTGTATERIVKYPKGASYSQSAANATGMLVFKHASVSGSQMNVKIKMPIFNASTATTNNGDVEINATFYDVSSTFQFKSGKIIGDGSAFNNQVRIAKDASGNTCIIIGDTGTVWSTNYLRGWIEELNIGFTGGTDTWDTAWSTSLETSLIGYTQLNSVSPKLYATQDYVITNAVNLTTAQTVAGIKTFSASPIIPNPTTSTQATNKGSVDALLLNYELISQIKSGSAVIAADGVLTTFTITHNFGSTGYDVAALTATNLLGATAKGLPYYISNKTANTFDIIFSTAPATGSTTFDYIIHKN